MHTDPAIYVKPRDVWDFYNENKELCVTKQLLLAASQKEGVEIYLTNNEDGRPCIYVYDAETNDELIERFTLFSQANAESTATSLYKVYLDAAAASTSLTPETKQEPVDDADDEPSVGDLLDIVYERDDELMLGLTDFLEVVFGVKNISDSYDDEELWDILDEFLIHLTDNHGAVIWRPTMLDDDAGGEIYCEYPYNPEEE